MSRKEKCKKRKGSFSYIQKKLSAVSGQLSNSVISTSQKIRALNSRKNRSRAITLITLIGSIGSATAIFTIPTVRSVFQLDASEQAADVDIGWQPYTLESEFTIKYPEEWVAQNTVDSIDGTKLRIMPFVKGDLQDSIYISVAIRSDSLEGPRSLDEYQTKAENAILTYLNDSKITSKQSTILGSSPAIALEYVGTVDGLPVSFSQTAAFEKDRLFILTYSAPTNEFDKYRETAIVIKKSFSIKFLENK